MSNNQYYINAAKDRPDEILWCRFKDSRGNIAMHNMKDANIIVKHDKTSTTEADLAIEKEFTEAQKRLENAQTELTEAQKNIAEIEKKPPLTIDATYDIYGLDNKLKCQSCILIEKLEPSSIGGKGAKQRRKTNNFYIF